MFHRVTPVIVSLPSFDPASLAATTYLRDYAGTPWVGTASAGTSGSHNYIDGTEPSVGADFGSHPSAYFDVGSKNVDGDSITLADLLTDSAFTVQVIAEFDSAGSPTDPYNEAALFQAINTNLYLTYTTDGIRAGFYDGTDYRVTTAIALATGVKACVQFVYDGTNIKCRVNGGSYQTAAAASVHSSAMGSGPRVGVSIDGRIAQVLTFASELSSGDLADLYADAQAHYSVP